MKIKLILLVSILSVGCTTNPYNDEKMYDLASQFKDLSQTIDGSIKFGETAFESGSQALDAVSKNQPNKLTPFSEYIIKVDLQGDNAVLLLCDDDIAIMEDAGCNAVLDKMYWKEVTSNSCQFTIDSIQLCN